MIGWLGALLLWSSGAFDVPAFGPWCEYTHPASDRTQFDELGTSTLQAYRDVETTWAPPGFSCGSLVDVVSVAPDEHGNRVEPMTSAGSWPGVVEYDGFGRHYPLLGDSTASLLLHTYLLAVPIALWVAAARWGNRLRSRRRIAALLVVGGVGLAALGIEALVEEHTSIGTVYVALGAVLAAFASGYRRTHPATSAQPVVAPPGGGLDARSDPRPGASRADRRSTPDGGSIAAVDPPTIGPRSGPGGAATAVATALMVVWLGALVVWSLGILDVPSFGPWCDYTHVAPPPRPDPDDLPIHGFGIKFEDVDTAWHPPGFHCSDSWGSQPHDIHGWTYDDPAAPLSEVQLEVRALDGAGPTYPIVGQNAAAVVLQLFLLGAPVALWVIAAASGDRIRCRRRIALALVVGGLGLAGLAIVCFAGGGTSIGAVYLVLGLALSTLPWRYRRTHPVPRPTAPEPTSA